MRIFIILISTFLSITGITQERTIGLFTNTEQSFNGYTLFSNNKKTYLIDNCGFIVNEWTSDYPPGFAVYLRPDGKLLRTGRTSGTFNTGGSGGIFELFDWDNNLIWSYTIASPNEHSHHDIALLPNGNFLALVWQKLTPYQVSQLGRIDNSTVWVEKIVEIEMHDTNEAHIVWEWNVKDHLVQDKFPDISNYGNISNNVGKLDFNYFPRNKVDKDWLHLNSISYNPELDQIAVSSRTLSEIYIIDHSTTKAEAKTSSGGRYGKGGDFLYRYGNPQVYQRGTADDQVLFNQHNIDWVNRTDDYDGDLTVFNNFYGSNQSAIHRWTPPYSTDGSYHIDSSAYGPTEFNYTFTYDTLFSDRVSSVQMLPNNNYLICEGKKGHLIEINGEEEIVWEYINPSNAANLILSQGDEPRNNFIFKAVRYPADFIGFDGKDLTPRTEIELNPIASECKIYIDTETEIVSEKEETVLNTIIQNHISINLSKKSTIYIMDIRGELIYQNSYPQGEYKVDLMSFLPGMYVLSIIAENSRHSYKIIKI